MENIYLMPKTITDKKGIYEYLTNFYNTYKTLTNSELIIDFKYTTYIKPTMMAPLGLILTKLKSQKNKIFLRISNNKIKNLLIKYKFISNINLNKQIPQNFIKYETFNGNDDLKFSSYLYAQLDNINNDEIISCIVTHFMEIFVNVKDHARIKSVSKYKDKEIFSSGFFDKNTNKVIFSLANNGQTFAENITSKLKYIFKHEYEYIEWAIKLRNTTTDNRPGGLGLNMLFDLVNENNGCMYILSGKGYYELIQKTNKTMINKYDMYSYFPGTVISVELPVNPIISNDNFNNDQIIHLSDIL